MRAYRCKWCFLSTGERAWHVGHAVSSADACEADGRSGDAQSAAESDILVEPESRRGYWRTANARFRG